MGLAVLLLLALVAVATFPFGLLKDVLADRLSDRFGRRVTIQALERRGGFGFSPTVVARGIRIPQADWAGSGDFARVEEAQATFSIWPLLHGAFAPRDIRIRGMRLALVRAADGRTNWSRPGKNKGGGAAGELDGLTVADSIISYRDDKQDRSATVRFRADPAKGLYAKGRGAVRGVPVTLSLEGAPVARRPWPFVARLDGRDLAMEARGTTDRPLDTEAMSFDVTARASDLKLIDAVIEAGLFRSQPVRLSAKIRHDGAGWTIRRLAGTIGTSALAGALTVKDTGDRTRIDGQVTARRLAFEDFASDEALAQGAAREARIGPRLVPDTRIDLSQIGDTDGRLVFRIDRVIGKSAPSLRAARGTLTLDHRRLEIAPVALDLAQGSVAGRLVVDQRGGRPVPLLSVDLRLTGSSVPALVGGGGDFTGEVVGHARLVGQGSTIRAAIGASTGRIGLVARNGALPEQIADALGFDAGRAFFASGDGQAGLRCAAVGLDMVQGRGRVDPMVVDTSASQMRGVGEVRFPGETVAIRLTGAPKQGSILRLPGAATMTGTIQQPHVEVPREVKSVGNVLRAIGRAITGRQGPSATDVDCGRLARYVLR